MAKRELKVVADGLTYLEGPRWHGGELWFVDFYTYGVYRFAGIARHNDIPNLHLVVEGVQRIITALFTEIGRLIYFFPVFIPSNTYMAFIKALHSGWVLSGSFK